MKNFENPEDDNLKINLNKLSSSISELILALEQCSYIQGVKELKQSCREFLDNINGKMNQKLV